MSSTHNTHSGPDAGKILMASVVSWSASSLAGLAGILLARHFQLSDLQGAQATMGLFGLAGGLSLAFTARQAGAGLKGSDFFLLATVWALSCIGAVTPLFYTHGLPMHMTILTFYCFSAGGAVGGVGSGLILRHRLNPSLPRDYLPGVLIWALSLGGAAVTSNFLSDALQSSLPGFGAWMAGFLAMALIMGAGSAGACLRLQQPGKYPRATPCQTAAKPSDKDSFLLLLLLAGPFYLNDAGNILISDWKVWLLVDYTAVKLFPLMIVTGWIVAGKAQFETFGISGSSFAAFASAALVGTMAGILIDQNGYLAISGLPGYKKLGAMPDITSPFWLNFDLTVGLVLVAVCEELVFRGYMKTVICRFTNRRIGIVSISALAFGLIHWSTGMHAVVITAVIGAVFMFLYLRTGSLPGVMLAHFIVNFVDFGKVIPKSLFRFVFMA
jgi:membrane protease YdiL (CAAX protease family)